MKNLKLLVSLLTLLFIFSISVNNTEASSRISIYINGEKQPYSHQAVIEKGTTLVPLRGIFEALGATVHWNQSNQTIDANRGNTTIWLKIGSKTAKVNGQSITISVPAQVKNGHTLVPLRFISESLGETVQWVGSIKTIIIGEIPEKLTSYLNGEKIITLDEFINRWNEMDPGRLSEEYEEMNYVDDGIFRGLGSLGGPDSYTFELDENNRLKQVSLNLTYPLSEEKEDIGTISTIPHDIMVLMNVLEPEIEEERKQEMVNTLLGWDILGSEIYTLPAFEWLHTLMGLDIYTISVSEGDVTYIVTYGDDRFWMDAIFNEF